MTRLRRLVPALLLLGFATGCTGTETDNPLDPPGDDGDDGGDGDGDRPPTTFESLIELSPRNVVPGCPPVGSTFNKPSHLPRWGVTGSHLIGIQERREVRWLDLSDPDKPKQRAQQPLDGWAYQLIAISDTTADVVFEDRPPISGDEIPDLRNLNVVPRLVRFALDDAGAPHRVASFDIEGEFWRLVQHDGVTWIMSARIDNPRLACDRTIYTCYFPDRSALLATGVRFEDGSFTVVQRVELPMTLDAWAAPEGFATLSASDTTLPGLLRYTRFGADGLLDEPSTIALKNPLVMGVPISLDSGLLRAVTKEPQQDGLALEIYELANPDQGPIASVVLPASQGKFFSTDELGVLFRPDATYVRGVRVEHSASNAPTVTHVPGAARVVASLTESDGGELLLGIATGDREAAMSLLRVSEGALTVVATQPLPGAGPGSQIDGADGITVSDSLVWVRYLGADRTAQAAALQFDGQTLEWLDLPSLDLSGELVPIGSRVHAIDDLGVRMIDTTSGDTSAIEWGYRAGGDVLQIGDQQISLIYTRTGPAVQVQGDGQSHQLAVSPAVDGGLLAAGTRVVAVGTGPQSECLQAGIDCSGYAPGVDVIETGPPARRVARVPFPTPAGAGMGDDTLEWAWLGETDARALPLDDGRLVFVADRRASCSRESECQALGIPYVPIEEAQVNATMQATCPPTAPDGMPIECEQPPPATVYGAKHERYFLVFDAHSDPPRFGPPGVLVLENVNSRFAAPVAVGDTVLSTRLETTGSPSFGPDASARFMLDRLTVDAEGALTALPPVNIPGYPVAAHDGGATVFTVEATGNDEYDVVLYRLAITDAGARVQQEQTIPGRYDNFLVQDGRAVVIRHSDRGCDATTGILPIDIETLAPGAELSLPGDGYRLDGWRNDRLELRSHLDSHIVIDMGDPLAPSLEAFRWPAQ